MELELSFADCHTLQHQVPCRVCGTVGLNSVLSQDDEPVVRDSNWSIDLAWCPTCSLVQWTETVAGDGPSHTATHTVKEDDAVRSLVERLRETRHLGTDSLVVEIAGQESGLLQRYHQAGIPVLEIQPAGNQSRAGGTTINEAFDQELALELVRTSHRADVIHTGSAFAQVEDLNGVVGGFATLLKPDGIAVVEVPYLKDLSERVGFNTPSREELCYFSLTALVQLFGQNGLEIVDIERLRIQGGVLRIVAAKSGTMSVSSTVYDLMDDESEWVRDSSFYRSFGETLAPSTNDRWAA